jgi:hypothetical protein
LWVQHNSSIPAPFQGYGIGTPISMGDVTIEMKSISSTKGQNIFTAPKGKHYVIIELSVRNISEKPITILPSTDTYMKDSSGKVT